MELRKRMHDTIAKIGTWEKQMLPRQPNYTWSRAITRASSATKRGGSGSNRSSGAIVKQRARAHEKPRKSLNLPASSRGHREAEAYPSSHFISLDGAQKQSNAHCKRFAQSPQQLCRRRAKLDEVGLLTSHFLSIDDVKLVTGTEDDRSFRYLPGVEFVDVSGRVTFGSSLGDIEPLQVDDYGLIVGELTKSWLIVWSPIITHAFHQW